MLPPPAPGPPPVFIGPLPLPGPDFAIRDVIIFSNQGLKQEVTIATKVVDFLAEMVPGLHTIDTSHLNFVDGYTQRESVILHSVKRKRFVWDLAAAVDDSWSLQQRRTFGERCTRAEIVLTAAGYDSCYLGGIFPALLEDLFNIAVFTVRDLHAREIFYYGSKGIECRHQFSMAAKRVIIETPRYQEFVKYHVETVDNTLAHFIQIMSLRDLKRLCTMRPGSSVPFQQRGRSTLRRSTAPYSVLAQ